VIIKVKGTLASGKTLDINFNEIRIRIRNKGAIYVGITYYSLLSKEFDPIPFKGKKYQKLKKVYLERTFLI